VTRHHDFYRYIGETRKGHVRQVIEEARTMTLDHKTVVRRAMRLGIIIQRILPVEREPVISASKEVFRVEP